MVNVRCHHDADGVSSAYFTSFGVKDAKIEIWSGEFGDTTGLTKNDYMCDMRPIQSDFPGTVIDHHGPYPEDRKYTLHTDNVPAGLIAFNLYKEDIPKSMWWKVALACVGDGQPELIPTEVYDSCPELLMNIKTSAYSSYGNWKINTFPTYKLLSSPVNALLRKGEYQKALNLVQYSEKPMNIINSVDAGKAKYDVKKELEDSKTGIMVRSDIYNLENLTVILFNSEYRMSGYVATVLNNAMNGKTVMAINRKNSRGSLRGDLAFYWRDKLKPLEYLICDGHPGFCGLTCTINPDTLIEDILKMM